MPDGPVQGNVGSGRSSLSSRNNLDLIRFGLASIVVIVHAQELMRYTGIAFSSVLSAKFAVEGFFVISGLLIAQSCHRSRSLMTYFGKRIRRIYPAYVTIILISVILGYFLTKLPTKEYFSFELIKFVSANIVFMNFIHPTLPGVFEVNPLTSTVNGALWTLKIEVMFYIVVPFILLSFRWVRWQWVLLAIFIMSVAYTETLNYMIASNGRPILAELARQIPGQMTYFCVGIALYMFSIDRNVSKISVFALGAVAYGLSLFAIESVFRPIGIGLIIIAIAYGPWLGNFTKYGDFSYGIYIIHFPIIQTLIQVGVSEKSPLAAIIGAYGLALIGSYFLWHLVEKRFLRSDSHYKRAEAASAEAEGTYSFPVAGQQA